MLLMEEDHWLHEMLLKKDRVCVIVNQYIVKHLDKFRSVFGGHLIYMNTA